MMKQNMFRVLAQTPVSEITKQDGTKLAKCLLILQLPGNRYEDSVAVTLLGTNAKVTYRPSQLVWASLRYQAKQVGENYINEVTANEIIPFN